MGPSTSPGREPSRRGPAERELLLAATPTTVTDWRAVAASLLSDECCAFHRNMEISARYAELYEQRPESFKWAAMAAIASHHVRLALFPLRLDTDGTGYVDLPRHLRRRQQVMAKDVDTIRRTNNAIFDDIFWVHLAYAVGDDGIERVRSLLAPEPRYAAVLEGFEGIDRGRRDRVRAEQPAARRAAEELVWAGNVELLRHEQRAVVQPNFDLLTCAFAWLLSIGSASSFGAQAARRQAACFTSFYLYSLNQRLRSPSRARTWPRLTRFEDRWQWLEGSVVPQFRRFDADAALVDASLQRIIDDAHRYASMPCVLPLAPGTGDHDAAMRRRGDRSMRRRRPLRWPRARAASRPRPDPAGGERTSS